MSFVCTICQDLVTERPQQQNTGEVVVLALNCGHVFHRACCEEWFRKLGRSDGTGLCPCCKKVAAISTGLQLFPSGDEEGQAIAERMSHAKANELHAKNLQSELHQMEQVMDDVGNQLENQKLENEIMRYEHAQKCSEVEELKRKIDEKDEMVDRIIADKVEVENRLKQKELEVGALQTKLFLETANKDSSKIRKMEQIHLNEIREYERLLNRKPVISKACQTDGRDAALLQARLVSYKSCFLHMQSEIRQLESEYRNLQIQPSEPSFNPFLMNEGDLSQYDSTQMNIGTETLDAEAESGGRGRGDANTGKEQEPIGIDDETMTISIADEPARMFEDSIDTISGSKHASSETSSSNEEYSDAFWCTN